MNNSIKRIVSLDYLRVIAAILVVAVHAETITISPTNFLGGISWWFATSINTFGRIAVPLFVMISGALIYRTGKAVNFSETLKRSWKRIIVPSIIWISFYFYWQNLWRGDSLVIWDLLKLLWTAQFGYLHYLFIVLGLYLATPLLSRIKPRNRSLIAWTGMIFMVIFEYIRYTGTGWAWTGNSLLLWAYYIPYYLLGSVLLDIKSNRTTRFAIFSLAGAALLVAIRSTYYANLATGQGQTVWYMMQGFNYNWDHFGITNVVVALATYYLTTFYLKNGLQSTLDKGFAKLGTATYGIYLVHVIIQDIVEFYGHLSIEYITGALWLYFIYKTALIFILAYLFVILVRKLRLGSILLGE